MRLKRQRSESRRSKVACGLSDVRPVDFRPSAKPKEGSALIIVLSVTVVLALIVANFAADLNSELKAAGGNYEEAVNAQLSRSALALARLEIGQSGAQLYANGYGDAYMIAGTEDYESAIEELQTYRTGYELGRGMCSYRLVYLPSALDPNELGQAEWHRLFEIACDMDEGTERSERVDRIIDWIDSDSNARANGMEEDDYQSLDIPRHVKNADLDSIEELLLVYGMTPALFYGTGSELRIEDGIIRGGGLQRYLIGDNSPQGRAAAQYVRQGILPADEETDEEEELEYKKVDSLPQQLYLIAMGYAPELLDEQEQSVFGEDEPEETAYLSRRLLLVKLKLGQGNNAGYELDDMIENASGEQIDRILAYGIPDEEI